MNWEVDAEGEREKERERKGGYTEDGRRMWGEEEKRRVVHCQTNQRAFSQNSVMVDKNREGWSVRSGGADVPRSGQL